MENENNGKIKFFMKNLLISILLTILLIFIFSIIISSTSVGENAIMPTTIFISSMCNLIGSFMVSKKIKEKGMINGVFFGGIYMLILYIISSIINKCFLINSNSIIMIICGILGGLIGGILGVNL